MRKAATSLELTATDLVGFLNCRRLSYLDLAVAEGALPKPFVWDPMLEILSERGSAHEESYVQHLILAGLDVAQIDKLGPFAEAEDETLAAMRCGVSVIVQGALSHDGWICRPDVMRRVEATRPGLGPTRRWTQTGQRDEGRNNPATVPRHRSPARSSGRRSGIHVRRPPLD